MTTATFSVDAATQRKIARIVALAWADSELFEKLKSNPESLLAEHGIDDAELARAVAEWLPQRPFGLEEVSDGDPSDTKAWFACCCCCFGGDD